MCLFRTKIILSCSHSTRKCKQTTRTTKTAAWSVRQTQTRLHSTVNGQWKSLRLTNASAFANENHFKMDFHDIYAAIVSQKTAHSLKEGYIPSDNELLPEVRAQPVWRNIASQNSPTMGIKPITQSTGKRQQSSTENKTVLPGGSRKLYISARKVIELWIETRAVISHAYERFLDATADRRIKTRKNWVPASSDEDINVWLWFMK